MVRVFRNTRAVNFNLSAVKSCSEFMRQDRRATLAELNCTARQAYLTGFVRGRIQFQSWQRSLVFCHHLISLFARASTSGGIVRPICLAVFRLITSSNFVGCSTGRSAGLAPFKILSTKYATRR
jgi:hypothetical protein